MEERAGSTEKVSRERRLQGSRTSVLEPGSLPQRRLSSEGEMDRSGGRRRCSQAVGTEGAAKGGELSQPEGSPSESPGSGFHTKGIWCGWRDKLSAQRQKV